jgi:hypothetical protein
MSTDIIKCKKSLDKNLKITKQNFSKLLKNVIKGKSLDIKKLMELMGLMKIDCAYINNNMYVNNNPHMNIIFNQQKTYLQVINNIQNFISNINEQTYILFILNPLNWSIDFLNIFYNTESKAIQSNVQSYYNINNIINITTQIFQEIDTDLYINTVKDSINIIEGNTDKNSKIEFIMNVGKIYVENKSTEIKTYYKDNKDNIFQSFKQSSSIDFIKKQEQIIQFMKLSIDKPIIFKDLSINGISRPGIFYNYEYKLITILKELQQDQNITYQNLLSKIYPFDNKQIGFEFENKVEKYLKKNFRQGNTENSPQIGHYYKEPNGSGQYPDFCVVLNNHILNIECKANSGKGLMFGNSVPDLFTLYIILSPNAKNGGVTFSFGKNLLTKKDQEQLRFQKIRTLISNTQINNLDGIVNRRVSTQFSTKGNYYINEIYLDIEKYVLSTNFLNTGTELNTDGIYNYDKIIDSYNIINTENNKSLFLDNRFLSNTLFTKLTKYFTEKFNIQPSSLLNSYQLIFPKINISNNIPRYIEYTKQNFSKTNINNFCFDKNHFNNYENFLNSMDKYNDKLDMYKSQDNICICHLCLQQYTKSTNLLSFTLSPLIEQPTNIPIIVVLTTIGYDILIPVRYMETKKVIYYKILPNYIELHNTNKSEFLLLASIIQSKAPISGSHDVYKYYEKKGKKDLYKNWKFPTNDLNSLKYDLKKNFLLKDNKMDLITDENYIAYFTYFIE